MTGATSDDNATTTASPAAAAMRGYRYKHGDRPLPGYTIQRAAGRGGFGEVYYALSDSGREVALKVVHAYEEIELRGIGQCMNLKSPHLVSIFDVRHADDGQPVVIMEYVSGPSLREIIDEHPAGLGTQKAAFFLREIGKGLTYLHDCGIVHRDLKPANIFYENGYVKIGDYGLSKVISASHRSGQTVTVGTLHYMAPEVGAGKYDRGIDIYALGALLYEMLTGQPPFFGISPAEVLMKHISAQVNVDNIEEPFATVIKKALAKDPNERYQTVQEMVEAVFGSEHVRQSVSGFSPADLTVVAGRVAQQAHLRGGQAAQQQPPVPLSSRAFDVAAPAHPGHRLTKLADRLRGRVQTFFGPFACTEGQKLDRRARRRQRREARWARWTGQPIPTPTPPAAPAPQAPPPPPPPAPVFLPDPLSVAHRVLLMIVATFAVAIAAGAFALTGIIGATLGVWLAALKVLPALDREPKFMRHLAAGGFGGFLVLATTLPVAVPAGQMTYAGHHAFHVAQTLAAICVALLVVDWAKRTTRRRPIRVSLGDLVSVGIAGMVTTAMFGGTPEIVIAVLAGTCLAVQLATPWQPRAPRPGADTPSPRLDNPPTDANVTIVSPPHWAPAAHDAPAAPNTDHPVPPAAPAAPPHHHNPFHGMSVYDVARRSVAVGKAAVVWPVRAAFTAVASFLVLATLVLALAVAFDLPGLLASGRVDPNAPQAIHHAMGIDNWPFALRSLGFGAMFVLACLGVSLLMLLRRSYGGVHMLRAVAGIGLLAWAPFMVAHQGINWTASTDRVVNGWQVWETVAQRVSPDVATRAAILVVAGVLLLLWPATRKRPATATAAVATPKTDKPADAPAPTTTPVP